MQNIRANNTQYTTESGSDLDAESRWYVVRTKPKEENTCVEHLILRGISVFCPMAREYIWRRRQTEIVPLFPGYAFARFVFPDQYYDVKWARGVNRLLQFGEGQPPVVDDSVIEFFRCRMDTEGVIDTTPELKPGDPVKFRTGPLKDLMGTVLSMDKAQERVIVLMELLYQATMEVDRCLVEAI
jgi:transcriptional antiterminator RfaH